MITTRFPKRIINLIITKQASTQRTSGGDVTFIFYWQTDEVTSLNGLRHKRFKFN